MSHAPLLALALAAPLSWLLMPLGIRLAWAVGWLDHPEARKLHSSATAVLGGAVVFVAAVIAWGVTLSRLPVRGRRGDARRGALGRSLRHAAGDQDARPGRGRDHAHRQRPHSGLRPAGGD